MRLRAHRLHIVLAVALMAVLRLFGQPTPTPQAAAQQAADRPGNIGRTELVQALNRIAAFDTASRRAVVADITNRQQAEAYQAQRRQRFVALLGGLPERTPLHEQSLGTLQADGYRIEKIVFESQPGFHVTALLYLPAGNAAARFPAIVMAPGHGATGKAGDFTTAVAFARNGFAVLSYDPIGQGERLQYPDPARPGQSLAVRPTGEHGEAGLQPTLIGDSVARYFAWDGIRAVDYLTTRSDIDPRRIGALGCSGGGAMTALLGALDPRVAAVGVACYNTSFDALLDSIGPQDGEQSSPGFLAAGFDFADLIELVAPRPYAAIATYNDMFPFRGARSTLQEARRFYTFFDPASDGKVTGNSPPATPTAPALNIDTGNSVPLIARLQFITGPGGHGALGPIMPEIVGFFLRNLAPGADAEHPYVPPPQPRRAPTGLPANAFQVTFTGQVATSFKDEQSIFNLNEERAAAVIPAHRPVLTGKILTRAIRKSLGSVATIGEARPAAGRMLAGSGPITLSSTPGVNLRGDLCVPAAAGHHPAELLLVASSVNAPGNEANKTLFNAACAAGKLVLALTPSPSPPGSDDMKAPILGPFYLLGLRAELVGRTLPGLRADDVLRAIDYLVSRPDIDAGNVTATGSGHMGLVLLYAGMLDPRLKHITVDHVLSSYDSLLHAPLPVGAPEDIVPGVLLHFDLPDLRHALGNRLSETDTVPGTADLSMDLDRLKGTNP